MYGRQSMAVESDSAALVQRVEAVAALFVAAGYDVVLEPNIQAKIMAKVPA
jgi:hypothetical protein